MPDRPRNKPAAWALPRLAADSPPAFPVEWPDDSALLFSSDSTRTAPAGSDLGLVKCLRCDVPVFSDPFHVWTLVGYYPCQVGSNHLVSVSAVMHVTCRGIGAQEIADRIRVRSTECFDQ